MLMSAALLHIQVSAQVEMKGAVSAMRLSGINERGKETDFLRLCKVFLRSDGDIKENTYERVSHSALCSHSQLVFSAPLSLQSLPLLPHSLPNCYFNLLAFSTKQLHGHILTEQGTAVSGVPLCGTRCYCC